LNINDLSTPKAKFNLTLKTMTEKYQTTQEAFWAGEFGNQYIERNMGDQMLSHNIHFFRDAFRHVTQTCSIIEFGANVGMNLKALQHLYPEIELYGVEINAQAAQELASVIPKSHIFFQSLLEFKSKQTWDMVLIKTVLIHIAPEYLPHVYESIYLSAKRYIFLAEYYNPSPVQIPYRGHHDRLYKRDFAGELMEKYPALKLVDYGFAYHRDTDKSQDDVTWFLLEKQMDC